MEENKKDAQVGQRHANSIFIALVKEKMDKEMFKSP
jgi:hypothetical protein